MSSLLMTLFLLYFSMHSSCVLVEKKPAESALAHQISSKDEMILHKPSTQFEATKELVEQRRAGDGDDHESSRNGASTQRELNSGNLLSTTEKESKGPISSGKVRSNSVGSVSSLRGDRKRNWEHPGFNLDYLPPRTHPPSHN